MFQHIFINIDSKNTTLILEVGFDIVNASYIIWLHGVVVLDYEYESDIEDGREEDVDIEGPNTLMAIRFTK